jgi:transcriptional regulator with XRE-family HTH domain
LTLDKHWDRMKRMRPKGPKTFSDQLRHILNKCGLSRYEIAKRSGVDEAALSRFVNGRRGLTTDTLDRLAEVLDLELVSRRRRKRGG